MIALLTAILGAAKPILDEVYFKSVMSYVNQYVDNERQIEAERANWPNWDDIRLGALYKERAILVDALQKQAGAVQMKATT